MSMPLKDHEILLLKQLRESDSNAFREIFDTYYKYLTVTSYRYLNDGEKAKDLVHDTFVDIWNRRKELKITSNLKSYLRQAVINKSLNYIKREKRIQFSEPSELPVQAVVPIAQNKIEADDTQQIIQTTIDSLPTKCRIVFVMSRFEEKSHKEIAEILGISTKTIENQITRALKDIRAALKRNSILIIYILTFFNNL